MRYRPIIALEDEPVINDGLLVSIAISDLDKERSSDIEATEIKVNQIEEANKEEEQEVSTVDTPPDDSSDVVDDAIVDDEFEQLLDSDELGEDDKALATSLDDVSSLESIAEAIVRDEQVELTPEQVQTIESINNRHDTDYSVSTEDFKGVMASVKAAIIKIWDYIVGLVDKIVNTIEEAIAMNKSKLKVLDDDFENIYKTILKIKSKTPKNSKIEPIGLSVLASTDTPTPKELLDNVTIVDNSITSYFDHVKRNSKPFIKSVRDLYNTDLRKLAKVVETKSHDGSKVIDTEGTLYLSKDTVPNTLKRVVKMSGRNPPFVGAIPMTSNRMPGGVKLLAWVSTDNSVTTEGPTDVLSCSISVIRDNDYTLSENDIDTPSPKDIVQFMAALKELRVTLGIAEGISMSTLREMIDIKKLVTKLRAEANALDSLPGFTNTTHVAAYKRRSAKQMLSLIALTKAFYTEPNQHMMFYSNRFMTAGLKYVNAALVQYVAAWEAAESV